MNALFVFKHQLFDLSRIIGLRDRLRCPECKAVGTWKPHGGWLDSADTRSVRRWLCKYCGFYRGPLVGGTPVVEGKLCYPSRARRCWVFYDDCASDTSFITPYELASAGLPKVCPWRG